MSHHYSGPDYGFPHGDARLDLTDVYVFPAPGKFGTSVLIMNVHPSVGVNPAGSTTAEPFATEAIYELKIDTNGDAVADVAYRIQFSALGDGQSAAVRRVDGEDAAGAGDGGQIVFEFNRFDERLAIFASNRFRNARESGTGQAAMRGNECFEWRVRRHLRGAGERRDNR